VYLYKKNNDQTGFFFEQPKFHFIIGVDVLARAPGAFFIANLCIQTTSLVALAVIQLHAR